MSDDARAGHFQIRIKVSDLSYFDFLNYDNALSKKQQYFFNSKIFVPGLLWCYYILCSHIIKLFNIQYALPNMTRLDTIQIVDWRCHWVHFKREVWVLILDMVKIALDHACLSSVYVIHCMSNISSQLRTITTITCNNDYDPMLNKLTKRWFMFGSSNNDTNGEKKVQIKRA